MLMDMAPFPSFEPPRKKNNSVLVWVLVGSVVFGTLFIGAIVLFLMSGIRQLENDPAFAVAAKYLPPEYKTRPAADGWVRCSFTYAGFEMDLPTNPEMEATSDPYADAQAVSAVAYASFGVRAKDSEAAIYYYRYTVEGSLMVEQDMQAAWQTFQYAHGQRQGKWLALKKTDLDGRTIWTGETDYEWSGVSIKVMVFGLVDGMRTICGCVTGSQKAVSQQSQRMAKSITFGQEKAFSRTNR